MAESKTTVYVAVAANFGIAAAKFTAAAIGGSSAMLAEAVHSLVDTANNGLLLLGMSRSQRPADESHPFGHGHDLYFYSLLVAVLIFGAGGAVSIYEGILHVIDPVPSEAVTLSYIVIAVGFLFEGASEFVAIRNFQRQKGTASFWSAVRASKDPTTFVVLFEDAAALAGLTFAAAGIFLSERLNMPILDGVASILIGLTLCGVALVLLRETKGLLIGEAASPEMLAGLRRLLAEDPAVVAVGRVLTMHMGPRQILVNAELHFDPAITSGEVTQAVVRIERRMRDTHDELFRVFIEPVSAITSGGAG